MKLGHIGLVGLLLVVTSEGLKLPKSFKLETRHHDVSSVVPGVSGTTRFIGPNSPLHSCLNAISTGSPEMLTPLCKAWALEFIRNRNSIEDTKVDLANNEEPQQNRSLQDLIVSSRIKTPEKSIE